MTTAAVDPVLKEFPGGFDVPLPASPLGPVQLRFQDHGPDRIEMCLAIGPLRIHRHYARADLAASLDRLRIGLADLKTRVLTAP